MENQTVLISGAGIAGPTLAYWLRAAGLEPTLVEQAPALRAGGFVIDFWGLGYDIAERMGLAGEINRIGYHMREMRVVGEDGARVAGFGTTVLGELTGGRFVTLARSDLARLLFANIPGATEVIFGEEIVDLEMHADCVQVHLKRSGRRRFDLVIGADGLHSQVRKLVFGAQNQYEKQLGYTAAAFEVHGYRPRDEEVYVIYNEPQRMLARFALHDDRTLFLFVFTSGIDPPSAVPVQAAPNVAAQKAILKIKYGDGRWECPRILDELDRTENLYFDRVSQIRMDRWSHGRVALVGDAAFCPSLMAGQGAALAMTAAYIMAGELSKAGASHESAFARYEQRLRSFIVAKQHAAERFAGALAPKTRWGLFLRNQVIRATAIPGLARLAFGRDIRDTIMLPNYSWP